MFLRGLALVLVPCVALQGGCRNLGDSRNSDGRGGSGGTAENTGGAAVVTEQAGRTEQPDSSCSGGSVEPSGGAGESGDAGDIRAGSSGTTGSPGSSGTAGSSDTAGSSGSSGTAGSSGSSGSSGTAGSSGSSGTTGSPPTVNCGGSAPIDPSAEEEVLTPGCVSGVGPLDLFVQSPRGLAASLLPNGSTAPYALYAAQPEANMVTLRWRTSSDDSSNWQPWACFDTPGRPVQLSATNVDEGPASGNFRNTEIYATTSGGDLFARRYTAATSYAWWQRVSSPRSNSYLTDVAATSSLKSLPFVFVLDDKKIFVRNHVKSLVYSNYSAWREIGGVPEDVNHLCAGVLSDGRQQLFVSTKNGDVLKTLQTGTDSTAGFGTFQKVVQASAHAMTDIDCGYLADGTLMVIGLSDGAVWSRRTDTPDSVDWEKEAMPASTTFTVFALGSRPARPPTVFGIDSANQLWWRVLGTTSWYPVY